MPAEVTPLDPFRRRARRDRDPFRRERTAPRRPPVPLIAPRNEPRAPHPDDPPPAA